MEPISKISPPAIWAKPARPRSDDEGVPGVLRGGADYGIAGLAHIPKGCGDFPVPPALRLGRSNPLQLPRRALWIRENLSQRGPDVFLRWVLDCRFVRNAGDTPHPPEY